MKKATRRIIIILALITLGVIYLPQDDAFENKDYLDQQAIADRAERMADRAEDTIEDAEDALEDAAEEGEDALEDIEDALEEIVDEVLWDDDEDAADENTDESAEENDEADENANAEVEGNTEVVIENAGYIDYSEEQFQSALDEWKDVALFFHATWCGTCAALNADIVANAKEITEETTVFKVDYDSSTELKKKYGITSQHTIVVVDAEWNKINSYQGTPTLDELLGNIESTKE